MTADSSKSIATKIKTFQNLENVKHQLILSAIFQPILFITKYVGIFPIQIIQENQDSMNDHNNGDKNLAVVVGSAYFKWFSWKSLFSFFLMIGFITDSTFIVAFYAHALYASRNSTVEFLGQIAFTCGQFVAASITVILIPFLTSRNSLIWNQLHSVIIFLSSNGIICKDYKRTYIVAYGLMILWIIFTAVYCVYTWTFYDDRLYVYYGQDGDAKHLYYLGTFLQISFTILISTHVLHSMIFGTICCVIVQSLELIAKCANYPPCNKPPSSTVSASAVNNNVNYGRIVEESAGQTVQRVVDGNQSQWSLNQFLEFIEAYEKLIGIIYHLSTTYGGYFIVQIITFIICTLANVIVIFSGHQEMQAIVANVSAILSYMAWLFAIGSTGEYLQNMACSCRNSLRVASLKYKIPGRVVYSKLGDTPPFITACNFFSINRNLIANILGTLTTYLIVILQFKISSEAQE